MKNTIQLFNAIKVEHKTKCRPEYLEEVNSHTIKYWFVFDEYCAWEISKDSIKEIAKYIWLSWEKANAAFHKSWDIIRDTPQEKLVEQAILHYMTTYWAENEWMFDSDFVFIPNEELDLPMITSDIKLTVIKGLTSNEILEKIKDLWLSWIALKQSTIDSIMQIIEENKYTSEFVKEIKNRELKGRLCDYFNIIPDDPIEFLRFVVAKVTDESLLIKNRYLIEKIKAQDSTAAQKLLDWYLTWAPKNLSEIFLRYKPIFLALKSISKNKTFFNRLRKDAIKTHKTIWQDYMNTITDQINKWSLDIEKFKSKLESSSVFRKIRLARALKFRLSPSENIVYTVRNGRSFVDTFEKTGKVREYLKVLEIVLASIASDMDVKWKTFLIPDHVQYTLPATEKQFVGNFPNWTSISVPENMVAGIHWSNTKTHRVDLDLKWTSINWSVWWDSSYSSAWNDVLFSWDITDAPNWATEAFSFQDGFKWSYIMTVNYYNHRENELVPTKIFVGKDSIERFNSDYLIDPSKILAQATIDISEKQSFVWLVAKYDWDTRFYFSESAFWNAITARWKFVEQTREFLMASLVDAIDIREVLEAGWANIITAPLPVHEDPEINPEVIDLSPENIDKTTFIDLLSK